MGSLFLAGCALIGGGLVWRTHGPRIMKAAQAAVPSQRYKGGFVDQMDRVEAGRILGKLNLSKRLKITDTKWSKQDSFGCMYLELNFIDNN